MRPGDPFATKVLDQLRSQQRRLLRELVPNEWWFQTATSRHVSPELGEGEDRALLEVAAREAARELLDHSPELCEYLKIAATAGSRNRLLRVVSLIPEDGSQLAQQVADLVPSHSGCLSDDVGRLAYKVLRLLLLAEDLVPSPG